MNLFTTRFLFALLLSGFMSCNIINPVEPVPAYLTISSVNFVNTPNLNTGSLSHKITDAWIYIDDDPVGVFEIPFTVPILKEGTHTVRIRAGIMQNGIAATRLVYPFFADYDTIINFSPEGTYTISPVFSYNAATRFSLLEDFEGTGLKLETSVNSDTVLVHINNSPLVFEGNGIGGGTMSDDNQIFETTSIDFLNLPKTSPVYLELNYKSELTFSTGFYVTEPGQVNQYSSGVFVNPSPVWNKIYIDMTTAINSSPSGLNYKLYIGALKTIDGTTKSLYIDNVKIVHW